MRLPELRGDREDLMGIRGKRHLQDLLERQDHLSLLCRNQGGRVPGLPGGREDREEVRRLLRPGRIPLPEVHASLALPGL